MKFTQISSGKQAAVTHQLGMNLKLAHLQKETRKTKREEVPKLQVWSLFTAYKNSTVQPSAKNTRPHMVLLTITLSTHIHIFDEPSWILN